MALFTRLVQRPKAVQASCGPSVVYFRACLDVFIRRKRPPRLCRLLSANAQNLTYSLLRPCTDRSDPTGRPSDRTATASHPVELGELLLRGQHRRGPGPMHRVHFPVPARPAICPVVSPGQRERSWSTVQVLMQRHRLSLDFKNGQVLKACTHRMATL